MESNLDFFESFGVVDASAAVTMATKWRGVTGLTKTLRYTKTDLRMPIPTHKAAESVLTVRENIRIEHVTVVFDADHPTRYGNCFLTISFY